MLARKRMRADLQKTETSRPRAVRDRAVRAQAAVSDNYGESAAPLSRRFTTLCVEIRGELRRAEQLSAALWLGLAALAGTCAALAFA